MSEIISKINLYHSLFLACRVAALGFFAAAAVFFVRRRVWQAIELLTGRQARKEIRRLERENDPDRETVVLMKPGKGNLAGKPKRRKEEGEPDGKKGN